MSRGGIAGARRSFFGETGYKLGKMLENPHRDECSRNLAKNRGHASINGHSTGGRISQIMTWDDLRICSIFQASHDGWFGGQPVVRHASSSSHTLETTGLVALCVWRGLL